MSFCEKLEAVQYKAALAITGAIQGTPSNKIYEELGIESIEARRWYRCLNCTFKILKEEAPNYLINLIRQCNQTIRTRNVHITIFHYGTDCFKYSFLPSTLKDWFYLDDNITKPESISVFKSRLLSLIRLVQIFCVFIIFVPKGLILLILGLGFNDLNEHRFRHNFENCISPLCSCSLVTEDTLHYLPFDSLHYYHFSQYRFDVMSSVKPVLDTLTLRLQ